MIKIEKINKSFDDVQVLKDVSAVFESGKTNLIIGKSGSGKTVMVKCMVGLMEVDNGNIYYGDVNYTELNFRERKEIRKEIGMLFQGAALFDSMSVEENVIFPLNMFTKMTLKEKRDRVNFVLDRVNLAGQNQKKPAELSGGMKKRVGIARSIVMQPKYLFCDEPNSGLDPLTSIVIDALIQEITEEFNITTVINTHDMNSVMEYGDKILYLHEGAVHWVGSKDEIIAADNPELQEFIFSSEFLKNARKALVEK